MSSETALPPLEIPARSASEEIFVDGDFIFSFLCKPGSVPAAHGTSSSGVMHQAMDQVQLPHGLNLAH